MMGSEISSLHDEKLVKWSTASCALALACRQYVSTKNKTKKKPKIFMPVVTNFNPTNQCVCIRVVDINMNEGISW